MKSVLKKMLITAVTVLMLSPLVSSTSFAETQLNVSGGDKVKGGDTFFVAVNIGGGNVGRVDAQMNYDTNKLTYISGGTSDGNAGYVNLSKAGTDGSIQFNIKFQAISDGDTSVDVTVYEVYDLNEKLIDSPAPVKKSISIKGDASNDEIISQTTSPDKPMDPTEMIGVDEKEEKGIGINTVLIIIAAVLVILIVTISVVLSKKRKK